LPFAIAVFLRAYPYLSYGVPYSTDSWSPIRNAQEILANTPTTLGGNPVFDNYNIYWPANSIFGAVASLVFNVVPIKIMPLIFPVVGATTVLIFFLIAEQVSGSTVVAFISSTLFATSGIDAIFTAAVTKETYAEPLFMLSILLILRKTDWRSLTLFSLVSAALALSHHATDILLVAASGSILATSIVLHTRNGDSSGKEKPLLFLISGVIGTAYLVVYAGTGLGPIASLLSVQDVLIAASFLMVFIAPIAYHSISRPSRLTLVEGAFTLGLAILALVLGTRNTLLPLVPQLPDALLYDAIPYVAIGVFAVLGYWLMQQAPSGRGRFTFVCSWLATMLALASFAIFSGVPGGIDLAYRLLAFISAPSLILASIAMRWLFLTRRYSGGDAASGRPGRIAVITILLLFIMIPTSYQTYQAAIGKDNLFGGQWTYQQTDLVGGQWISGHMPKGSDLAPAPSTTTTTATTTTTPTVAADTRMQYLLTGYLGMSVDTQSGYIYLQNVMHPAAGNNKQQQQLLVTYSLMDKNGYVLLLYGLPLPPGWKASLQATSPIIYSDGNIILW
jgi:uncharacterized membrane protein